MPLQMDNWGYSYNPTYMDCLHFYLSGAHFVPKEDGLEKLTQVTPFKHSHFLVPTLMVF